MHLSNRVSKSYSQYHSINVDLEQIRAARANLDPSIIRTPLVPFNFFEAPCEIFLKLECLQPTGSFKVRGAANSLAVAGREATGRGIYTASAGNMAQALAWLARKSGIKCTTIVPDSAPETKLAAIRRYGAELLQVPFEEVWEVVANHGYGPLSQQFFIHPFADDSMIAGNGTIGLEILEDLPDVDSVVVPFGGGGLFAGIATAIKTLKPSVKMYASETETAAPLTAAIGAKQPKKVQRIPSFVDGIGSTIVLEEIWHFVNSLLEQSIASSIDSIAGGIRLLAERNRIVAEGAAGSGVAAALSGKAGKGKVVCVISGGNIDSEKLAKILEGITP
jgi:threonine dehydratase